MCCPLRDLHPKQLEHQYRLCSRLSLLPPVNHHHFLKQRLLSSPSIYPTSERLEQDSPRSTYTLTHKKNSTRPDRVWLTFFCIAEKKTNRLVLIKRPKKKKNPKESARIRENKEIMSQGQLQSGYSGRLDIERMFNAAQNISFDGHNSGKRNMHKCIPQIMLKVKF